MRLYHGSTVDIDVIDFSFSKPNKDFGKGFYLSADRHQAEEMAAYKAFQMNKPPVVNVYDFDAQCMSDGSLNVKLFDGYSEEWANFVFGNRMSDNGGSIHQYDIVYGPIANDRVGLQIRRYMEHEISFEVFLERLKYMKGVTYQYFFGTQRAINQLKKIYE